MAPSARCRRLEPPREPLGGGGDDRGSERSAPDRSYRRYRSSQSAGGLGSGGDERRSERLSRLRGPSLYAEAGATEKLKALAMEVMPVFESREVQREAMAALLFFQSACLEESMTATLARYLADFLRRERYTPAAPNGEPE